MKLNDINPTEIQHIKTFLRHNTTQCNDTTEKPNITDLNGGSYIVHDGQLLEMTFSLLLTIKFNCPISLQEVIRKDTIVRLFADLDSSSDIITDEDINIVVQAYKTCYINLYNVDPKVVINSPVKVVCNEQKGQHKVHLYFPNLITNKAGLKYIATYAKENCFKQSKFIDDNYSGLRLVYNCKKDDVKSVYIPDGNSYADMFMNLITYRIRALPHEKVPDLRNPDTIFTSNNTSIEYEDMDQKQIDKALTEVDLNVFKVEFKNNTIQLRKQMPSYCDLCGRVHDNLDSVIYSSHGYVYLYCYAGETKQLFKARERTRKELDNTLNKRIIKCERDQYKDRLVSFEVIKDEYNSKYVKPLCIDRYIQLIEASMDTGKTVALFNFIKQYNQVISEYANNNKMGGIVFLVQQRSFANDLTARLMTEGIIVQNYLNVDVRKIKYGENIIISSESLHSLSLNFACVVIDEVTSFLSQMNSGLHNKLSLDRIQFSSFK